MLLENDEGRTALTVPVSESVEARCLSSDSARFRLTRWAIMRANMTRHSRFSELIPYCSMRSSPATSPMRLCPSQSGTSSLFPRPIVRPFHDRGRRRPREERGIRPHRRTPARRPSALKPRTPLIAKFAVLVGTPGPELPVRVVLIDQPNSKTVEAQPFAAPGGRPPGRHHRRTGTSRARRKFREVI